MIITALVGGLATIWHIGATDALFTSLIDKNMASFQAAEGLEIALLRQEGYLTYYFLDNNPEWLNNLQQNHQSFLEWLRKARNSATTPVMEKILALIVLPSAVLMGLFLAYILTKQLLEPIRQLSRETGLHTGALGEHDEVRALSRRVHNLMENVDQAQTKLEQSQEHLLQSEKMAMVGKLAAGVAHSIRNPLTSVKMPLFSLGRTLDLSPTQHEDFEVISEKFAISTPSWPISWNFPAPPNSSCRKSAPRTW